ncbi:MAG: pirin family protein [Pseudomonadota bacterium]
MIEVRPFGTLGRADHGWLKANHHFSFARYYEPKRMGHGALLVWNDDEIAPNTGFPPHGHRSMEIITYVRSGAITHEDNLGNRGRTEAGDVQVMSAGKGIRHAEYNFEDEPTAVFQIWIEPHTKGGAPSWGNKPFPKDNREGGFITLASGFEGDLDALPIRAQARVLGAKLKRGERAEYRMGAERHGYLVPAKGKIEVNGILANKRDGIALTNESLVTVKAIEDTEIVLTDTR